MYKKCGFTLAEVLITLGIIGVVAATTIPTLTVNINSQQWDTAATVFTRKLEEALKTMNTQQTLAGHSTTESFVEELSKHFKTNKICSNDKLLDCFSGVVYWGGGDATPEEVDINKIKNSRNFGQKDWGTEIIGAQFANGVTALIAYNPDCSQDPYSNQITGDDCLAILYDTSGHKNPNTSGKDLRANKNVSSLNNGCAFEINGNCFGTPFTPEIMSKSECNALIASGELDMDECYFDSAYASAVKKCGGINKLPTKSMLDDLAKYLYNIDYVHDSIFSSNSLVLDKEKAIGLGINIINEGRVEFNILMSGTRLGWNNEARFFYTDSTYNGCHNTGINTIAFCLLD